MSENQTPRTGQQREPTHNTWTETDPDPTALADLLPQAVAEAENPDGFPDKYAEARGERLQSERYEGVKDENPLDPESYTGEEEVPDDSDAD